MEYRELQEFFGARVIVQFRDGVVLVKSSGKEIVTPFVDAKGGPEFGPQGVKGRKQIVAELPDDESKRFTLVLAATLFPADDGKRVYVAYETGDCVAKMSIRPEDIYQVSVIEGRVPDSPIVTP